MDLQTHYVIMSLKLNGYEKPTFGGFNPNSALENSNAEMTKKLLFKHFLSGLTSYESYTTIGVVRPETLTKIKYFVRVVSS